MGRWTQRVVETLTSPIALLELIIRVPLLVCQTVGNSIIERRIVSIRYTILIATQGIVLNRSHYRIIIKETGTRSALIALVSNAACHGRTLVTLASG